MDCPCGLSNLHPLPPPPQKKRAHARCPPSAVGAGHGLAAEGLTHVCVVCRGAELKNESQAMRLTFRRVVCFVGSVRALKDALDGALRSTTAKGACAFCS